MCQTLPGCGCASKKNKKKKPFRVIASMNERTARDGLKGLGDASQLLYYAQLLFLSLCGLPRPFPGLGVGGGYCQLSAPCSDLEIGGLFVAALAPPSHSSWFTASFLSLSGCSGRRGRPPCGCSTVWVAEVSPWQLSRHDSQAAPSAAVRAGGTVNQQAMFFIMPGQPHHPDHLWFLSRVHRL